MNEQTIHQGARVAVITGEPKHKSGAAVKVGDIVKKADIDSIEGGTIELDRHVPGTYRFPVWPGGPMAAPPALRVDAASDAPEVGDVATGRGRRR